MDANNNPVQRFEDFEEVSIQFSNIDSISLQVDVLEPMDNLPWRSFAEITELETHMDITDLFTLDGYTEEGFISDIGMFQSFFPLRFQ